MSFCFSKGNRLLTKNDFSNLRDDSKRLGSSMTLAFVKPNNRNKPRLGIAIGKKFGNAVRRNKLKRIVREQFRLRINEMAAFDVLITLKKNQFPEDGIGNLISDLDGIFARLAKK